MATFLDTGILQHFLPLFSLLFIFSLIYAIMQTTKLFGESKTVHLVVAFSISMIVLFSGQSLNFITFVTPWFVALIVGLVLFFMAVTFLGVTKEKAWDAVGGHTVVFIIAIIIVLVGLSQVLGPVFSPFQDQPGERTIGKEILRTLFHPRLLGALFILIISAFAVSLIAKRESK